LEGAVAEAVAHGANGLLPLGALDTDAPNRSAARIALRYRLPSIYGRSGYADRGGLLAFSVSATEETRRAAVVVDKLLRGARPSDIVPEEPTSFFLVANLKTAERIGLTLPPSIIARATRLVLGPVD